MIPADEFDVVYPFTPPVSNASKPAAQRLLEALREERKISLRTLGKEIGIPPGSLARLVSCLEAQGCIRREGKGRFTRFRVVDPTVNYERPAPTRKKSSAVVAARTTPSRVHAAFLNTLESPIERDVWKKMVLQNPPLSGVEMATRISRSRTVAFSIQRKLLKRFFNFRYVVFQEEKEGKAP